MATTQTTKITGKTYHARSWLKDCGFVFDKTEQAWFGDDAAKVELERTSTASYSRANAKLLSGLTVESV
jgi:hypothetical protein